MKKRLLSIFLTAAVLLCCMPLAFIQAATAGTPQSPLTMVNDYETLTDDAGVQAFWTAYAGANESAAVAYSADGGVDGSKAVKFEAGLNNEYAAPQFRSNLISIADAGLQFWVKSSREISGFIQFVGNGCWLHDDNGTVKVPFTLKEGEQYISFAWADKYLNDWGGNETAVQMAIFFTYPGGGGVQSVTLYVDNLSTCEVVPPAEDIPDDQFTLVNDYETLTDDAGVQAFWTAHAGDNESAAVAYSADGGVDGSKAVKFEIGLNNEYAAPQFRSGLISIADAGLQFWVKSSREVSGFIQFVGNGCWLRDDNGTIKVPFTLKEGEQYVSFDWADKYLNDWNGNETAVQMAIFFSYPGGGGVQNVTLYVDNLRVYKEGAVSGGGDSGETGGGSDSGETDTETDGETGETMDPTHKLHGDDVILWDNMDYADYEEAKQFWNPEHYNKDGKGSRGYLETDPENVYGGSGTSLKMIYDRTKTNWRSAAWVNMGTEFAPIAVRGEGLTFWLKSNRAGTIVVFSLDSSWATANVTGIPVVAGENIIQIPWSAFKTGDQPATMTLLRQIGIGFDDEGGDVGTVWLDAIGFYGVEEDSYDEWDLLPPDSYESYIDGEISAKEDFDQYTGEDDLEFYLSWGNTETANTQLVENGNGYAIEFSYTLPVNRTVNMACYAQFKEIDLGGGISFYAKANMEAYVELQITLDGDDEQVYVTHFKTSTEGKTYKIPFSAFWKQGDKSVGIDTESTHTHSVTQMVFVTGYGITPPVMGVDASGTIVMDNICFTNSKKEIARPEAFDKTENGVRFESAAGQFPVLSTLKIEKQELDAETEKMWLEAMGKPDASIYTMLAVTVENMNGNSVDPEGQVTLTFDLPAGSTADNVGLYLCYMDGSAEKQEITVSGGKAILKTYFLGTFALAVDKSVGGNGSAAGSGESPDTGVELPVMGLVMLAVSAGTLMTLRRKKN